MIRRTFLRLAAVCVICPALDWIRPQQVGWRNFVQAYAANHEQLLESFHRAAEAMMFLPPDPESQPWFRGGPLPWVERFGEP